MLKCPTCLSANPPAAAFCNTCGQRFSTPTPRPKPTDTPGDKILGLVLGVGLFAIAVWAADWVRIYPAMAAVVILDCLLIIILAAKAYNPRADFFTYFGAFLLFIFPATTMLVWYHAGLYLARQLNPR